MTATLAPSPDTVARSPARPAKLALPVKLFLAAMLIPLIFNLGPLQMSLIRLLLLIMVAPLTGMLLAGRFGRLHLTDFAYLALGGWVLLSVAVNDPSRVLQFGGSVLVEFLGGYVVARAYIRDRASFIALCKLLGWIVVALLPFAIFETITGRNLLLLALDRVPATSTENPILMERRLGLKRVQGTFSHPIHFGLFCSTAFSLVFVGLVQEFPDRKRIIVSVLITLATFFSLSSGAILSIVLQFGLIIWFVMFRRNDARWWILLGLMVAAYVVVDLLSNRTPVRVFMSYATFSPHNAYWRGLIFDWGMRNIFGSAPHDIPAAPWFGIGLSDWERPAYMHDSSVDNFWLLTAMRHGVPAFIFLVVGYGGAIIDVGRRNFSTDAQLLILRRAWIFVFIGLSFTLATVHIWTAVYSYVFFLFGAGMWMLTATPQNDTEPDAPAPADTQARAYSRFPVRSRPATATP